MSNWAFDYAGNAKAKLKRFEKKSPNEFRAVMANLNRYFEALADGTPPRSITAGFVHPERNGVIALDESGGDADLASTRLYIGLKNTTVYILGIGGKTPKEQNDDIQNAVKLYRSIRGGQK